MEVGRYLVKKDNEIITAFNEKREKNEGKKG